VKAKGFIAIWIVILGAFFSTSGRAQTDSLLITGQYYESNVYIFNPSVNDSTFSIYLVVMNGDSIYEELRSNAIEVDLEMWNLEPEADVSIAIYFDSLYPAFVVNPEVLYSPTRFKFSKPRIRKENLYWRVYGDVSEHPIVVQQFKWNRWQVIAEVDPLDTVENAMYSIIIDPHSGTNQYRLKTTNLQDEVVYSKILRFRPSWIPEVFILEYKVKNELEFSRETDYELYDAQGIKIKEGTARYVDVGGLSSGEYWVNYDNKSEKIKKK
jgi:hypothetical protein